ncbi:S66 peptidase family protein [Halotalea alkalilenta]|uniref:S66 peptidase family protein n=1 Tax=Halotalea alkalilenta TaxID=376489 RepID=UPI000481D76E|nr:LD-carboxypeptidase [Halotalea alkalilenta]
MPSPLWRSPKRVALIAPAGAVDGAALDECLSRLDSLGIEALPSDNVTARHRYLAGHVDARLDDLYQAYGRPDVDAVWCLRGGYGCAQLLDRIDWSRIDAATRRPLIGYSDISALLVAFAARGLAAIHGPVACELNKLELEDPELPANSSRWQAMRSIAAVIDESHGTLPIAPWGHVSPASGRLLGGNLTVLASLCGTAAALRLEAPSLLLLEDVGEPLYRLERSFFQLLESLDKRWLDAVCLGEFKDCPVPGSASSIAEVFAEWLAPHDIALYTGLAIGHGERNLAWPFGAQGRIDGARLSFTRAPCRMVE